MRSDSFFSPDLIKSKYLVKFIIFLRLVKCVCQSHSNMKDNEKHINTLLGYEKEIFDHAVFGITLYSPA